MRRHLYLLCQGVMMPSKLFKQRALLGLVAGLCACRATPSVAPQTPSLPGTAPVPGAAPAVATDLGFDQTALDRSVEPCHDFYRYACGAWLARTPIPPDHSSWTRSFSVIHERNEDIVHGILDAYAAGRVNPDEPDAYRVSDFYASCLDEPAVDRAGDRALSDWMARIAAISDLDQLATLVRWMQDRGFDVFFSFGPNQDFHDATQMIGEADQGGLGLPDREYYLKDDPASRKLRDAYQSHVARMLGLAGETAARAATDAEIVLDIETELARASMSLVDRRDPNNVYHRLERSGLEASAPDFPWRRYFVDDLADVHAINVAVPAFFAGLNRLLKQTPIHKLRVYLRWHAVSDHAMSLGPRFVDEAFAFSSKNLTGAKVLLPRWKRCADATEAALGEAVAQPFVKKVFSADAKRRALSMVHDIETAFAQNLKAVAWMDAPTRAAALEKLHAVYDKIGYPDKWRRYDRVRVDRHDYIQNVLSANAFESGRQYAKIGKPVDRQEWAMTPMTVNAYYNSQLNEMVFPAGILQPPFFALDVPASANYGGIGMVLGHELTHGFDDQGRKFDKFGNLRDWWTTEAARAYEEKTACLVKQFASYHAVDDVLLNGKLTLGENIADLGGIKLAFLAYLAQRQRTAKPSRLPTMGGYTDQQRFFLAFAQSWCTNRRPELSRSLAAVDPHSPPQDRVNGTLSNLPAFAAAFSCPVGSPMAPRDRCGVW